MGLECDTGIYWGPGLRSKHGASAAIQPYSLLLPVITRLGLKTELLHPVNAAAKLANFETCGKIHIWHFSDLELLINVNSGLGFRKSSALYF